MKKTIIPKYGTTIEIISAIFVLVFLYTAVSKYFRMGGMVNALLKAPIFSQYAQEIAWITIFLEFAITILLLLPGSKKVGLYGSLCLMVSFTMYIVFMKAFVPNLPCSCGGVISKMTWTQHLIFNCILILLALTAIKLTNINSKQGISRAKADPVVFT